MQLFEFRPDDARGSGSGTDFKRVRGRNDLTGVMPEGAAQPPPAFQPLLVNTQSVEKGSQFVDTRSRSTWNPKLRFTRDFSRDRPLGGVHELRQHPFSQRRKEEESLRVFVFPLRLCGFARNKIPFLADFACPSSNSIREHGPSVFSEPPSIFLKNNSETLDDNRPPSY